MTTDEEGHPVTDAATWTSGHTFEQIVVALDGSKEAEAILPYVEPIARAFNSHLTFVCALVPVDDTVSGKIALTEGGMAMGMFEAMYEVNDALDIEDESYLAKVRKQWAARGFDVEYREPQMRADLAIVETAREKGADLIAMATHGRTGIGRTILGSVTDEVVRTAPCAVMVIRPE